MFADENDAALGGRWARVERSRRRWAARAVAASVSAQSAAPAPAIGRLDGGHATSAPKVRAGATTVSGRLPPEVIQRIVRQNFGRFRMCYEQGLGRNPALPARWARASSSARTAASRTSRTAAPIWPMRRGELRAQRLLRADFPQPESGVVTVVYPLSSSPAAAAPSTTPAPRRARASTSTSSSATCRGKCSAAAPAASAPFEERVGLWRERLSKVAGNAPGGGGVYRSALGACEAPSYRERARSARLMLDAMPGVSGKVALYRTMARDLGAADGSIGGSWARIRTPEEMRELHRALGLTSVDPGHFGQADRGHGRPRRTRPQAQRAPRAISGRLGVGPRAAQRPTRTRNP
jgi:hypothetical protein